MHVFATACGLTNGLRVTPRHVCISDCHLMGLMTLDPIWSEVILVISVPYAFDKPHGEQLHRDRFALILSAIGNEELGQLSHDA